MSNSRLRKGLALIAAANIALPLLAVPLYSSIGFWSLIACACAAFFNAAFAIWLVRSQVPDGSNGRSESFTVYRQAFGVLDSYLHIAGTDDTLFFKDLLDRILTLADAEFGFVGVVLHDDEGKPFLRTRWISDIAWDEGSKALFSPQGMEFSNLDTLFGFTLRTGEHLITNEPETHSEAGGFPPGHPPVTSYLGVPLKSGGELVGMIGLGNRPDGFEVQNLRDWRVFFDICAEIIRHSILQGQLNQARERYQQLFEEAPSMYVLTEATSSDETGPVITSCNEAFSERLGYTKAEILGRPIAEFYDEHSRALLLGGAYSRALECGIESESRTLIGRHGARIPTLLKAVPLTNEEGEAIGTQAMFVDLSEVTTARQRGQDLEVSFRRLLGNANSLIVEVDDDFRTLSMSAGMLRLLRYKTTQKTTPDFLSMVADEDSRHRIQSAVKQVIAEEAGHNVGNDSFEILARTRYGDSLTLRISIDRLVSGVEQNSVWIAAQDVTDSQTKARLDAETQRAESLTKLTGNIAHEFNNILTIISSNLRVLSDARAAAEERLGAAEDAHGAISDASELTQTLLAYSGQQVLRPSVILLGEAIESVVKRWRIKVGGAREITVLSYPVSSYCRLDQSRLNDLLDQVLQNAFEASQVGGRIEIAAKRVQLTLLDRNRFPAILPGAYLVITVRDDGQGIPMELMSRVREPFFSTKSSRGLGLSNASGILKQSGGDLHLESSEGVGTLVSMWLPDDVQSDVVRPSDITARLQALSGGVKLIADDNSLCQHVSAILENSRVSLEIMSSKDLGAIDALNEVVIVDSALGTGRIRGLQREIPDGPRLITLCDPLHEKAEVEQGGCSVPYPLTSIALVECLERAFQTGP